MLDKNTTNNITHKARNLELKDYRLEAIKVAMDLLKNAGKKRFKKEFFDEMKDIADNIICYMETGKTLEQFLNMCESNDSQMEETK